MHTNTVQDTMKALEQNKRKRPLEDTILLIFQCSLRVESRNRTPATQLKWEGAHKHMSEHAQEPQTLFEHSEFARTWFRARFRNDERTTPEHATQSNLTVAPKRVLPKRTMKQRQRKCIRDWTGDLFAETIRLDNM
eukprot:1100884-Amphidinium_carterae.1